MLALKKLKYLAVITCFLAAGTLQAEGTLFNAYPGTYNAKNANVEKANIVYLMVAAWDGFPKKIRITLPDLKVPVAHSKSKACEIKLVKDALQFSLDYFVDVERIEVKDIQMERTDMIDGVSKIYTNKGTLGAALLAGGFARSSSISDTAPWC